MEIRLLKANEIECKRRNVNKPIEFYINDNGCFICTSHYLRGRNKYPCITIKYRQMCIYQHIYQECFGKIPAGNVIRHTCDNHLCINPEHLACGTVQDNVNDRVSRGRSAVGERSGRSKLNNEAVIEILINEQKLSPKQLAVLFGVSVRHIQYIKSGKSWTHLLREVR
jgi:hypothetical protein